METLHARIFNGNIFVVVPFFKQNFEVIHELDIVLHLSKVHDKYYLLKGYIKI